MDGRVKSSVVFEVRGPYSGLCCAAHLAVLLKQQAPKEVPSPNGNASRREKPAQEWFSIEEVAVITGLSDDHVRRHVTAGLLPVSNHGTFEKPYYRIHRRDVDAWMERRREAPAPAPRRKPARYVSRHHKPA